MVLHMVFQDSIAEKIPETELSHASKLSLNCFIILRLEESRTPRLGLFPGMSQELRSVQALISATQIQ